MLESIIPSCSCSPSRIGTLSSSTRGQVIQVNNTKYKLLSMESYHENYITFGMTTVFTMRSTIKFNCIELTINHVPTLSTFEV